MAINGKLRKIDYNEWSKPELIREVKKLEKRKKYGIVWDEERTKEIFEEEIQHKLPVLTEIKSNEIITSTSRPFHLLIEGDNYHTLSILNYTHKGKIDVIYIDPPYNTGNNDFIYNDRFVDREDSYRHSKWLSYMNKRLKLAKNLLSKQGMFFISIDDNEQAQLKLLCNEIFGEDNFQGCISRVTGTPTGAGAKAIVNEIDYVLVYSKSSEYVIKGLQLTDDDEKIYDKEDDNGRYLIRPLRRTGNEDRREDRPTMFYPLKAPDGTNVFPLGPDGYESRWRCGPEKYKELARKNLIEWNRVEKNGQKIWQVYQKFYLEGRLKQPTNLWKDIEGNKKATTELKELFNGEKIFEHPKPVELIKKIIKLSAKENSIILDFFAGSGTTGHAVLELTNEDDSNMKFILCTNNEGEICTNVCYPRLKKVISGYANAKKEKIVGSGGNLKYFKTEFVGWEPTDKNRRDLVQKSTEMLCLKEDCFEIVKTGNQYKIFKNQEDRYLGIIYYFDGIELFKKEVAKLNKKIDTYVFSLSDIVDEEEFQEVSQLVNLKPIPASILNVYRRIFAYVQTKKLSREIHSGTDR